MSNSRGPAPHPTPLSLHASRTGVVQNVDAEATSERPSRSLLVSAWCRQAVAMVQSEPPETTEEEKKKLFDPRPLKLSRPPLSSDPRSLIEKASRLSLHDRPERGPRLNSASLGRNCSDEHHVIRKPARPVQSRLQRSRSTDPSQKSFHVIGDSDDTLHQEQTYKLVQSSVTSKDKVVRPRRQSFRIIDDKETSESSLTRVNDDSALSSHQNKTGVVDSISVNVVDSCTSSESENQTDETSGNWRIKGRKLPLQNSLRKPVTYPSQNWRLKVLPSKPQFFNSGVAPAKEKHSTPLIRKYPNSHLGRDAALRIRVNQSLVSSAQSCDSHETDSSFNVSSISSIDDEILCLNPFDTPPQPLQLLHCPENLRRYTPLHSMDRTSSPVDSGIGSLSASERADELSTSWAQGDGHTSPVPSESCETSSQAVVREESDLSQKSSCGDSVLDSTDDGFDTSSRSSTGDQIVGSWRVQHFSACAVDKPVVSKCSTRKIARPAQVNNANWNHGAKSEMAAMGLPTSFGHPNALKRKANDFSRRDPDLQDQERTCFGKTFKFAPSGWRLPEASALFSSKPWVLENFLGLKQKLNSVKDELNDLSLQDWHAHTRRRNKAGHIIWQLRKKIDPEFPTQAWCKFYENVSSFPLVPQKAVEEKKLRSVHLCEAPGAFITSLNHFLRVNHGADFDFDWRAVTLNPYYEGNPLSCMINDDRLILQTLDKWLFGQDSTGDLMKLENLANIVEGASKMGEVLLVTADGSVDCQDNPAEQEDLVSGLHFCETVTALKLLAPGGSFLVKMFTFYEHFSIGLLYLLNCVFKSVTVNKPATSKEGNSEVYVVCCGYVGSHTIQPWLEVLLKNYGPNASVNALFPLSSIPSTFLDQMYRCADFFRRLQTDVIKENIRSYHHPGKKDNCLTVAIRHRVADSFFKRYKLQKLDRSLYMVHDKKRLKDATAPNLDPKGEEGSFNDRRKRLASSPEEELAYIKDDLRLMDVAWPGDYDVFWLDFPDNPKGFKIVKGKPITKVNSSKFCLGKLLKLRNRVREIAYDHFKLEVLQKSSERDSRVFPWPDEQDCPVKRKIETLDFKNRLWSSLEDGSNATNEKSACREILSILEHKVFRDDCLELRGYPLLTQFNVGLVFLLGHLFEKVGFVRPKGQDIRVLFYNYKKFNPQMKRHWDEVVSVMDHDSEAVLSVVQISELADGDFYKYVTEINNLCVVEQIQDLLDAMSTKA